MNVTVCLKSVAKRNNSVQSLPFFLARMPETVGELIEETVRTCVEDYNGTMEREVLKCLSKEEIGNMGQTGKIGFGVNYGECGADFNKALENALQSYEDGIFRIFIDGKDAGKLSDAIVITEESILTFVRLVMLAGRLW